MIGRWLAAAVMTLLVPTVAFIMIGALDGQVESDWQAALVAEYGPLPDDVGDELTLGVLCGDPGFVREAAGACGDANLLDVLHGAAVASVLVALVVLVVAGGTALVTRGNRRRMALLFRPALVVVLFGTAFMLVLQAALVIGLLWEAMTVWLGYIWPWLLVVLGGAAVLAVGGVLRAIGRMLQSPEVPVQGLQLRREAHPRLFEEIDQLAIAIGTDAPDHVVAGLEPNFFVVDARVRTFDGVHTGRTLYVSSPLCAVLSVSELRAVLGHELGHFRGEDTAYSKRITPLYAAGRASLGALAATQGHWSGVVSIPAAVLLGTVFDTLASGVSAVSRARELEADRAGAEAATSEDLGRALRKLEVVAEPLADTILVAVRAAATGRPLLNIGSAFTDRVLGMAGEPTSSTGAVTHPFDTHPPLAVRLAALGLDPADPGQIDLLPDVAAAGLLGDAGGLNTRLSTVLATRIRAVSAAHGIGSPAGPSDDIRAAAREDAGIAAVATLIGERRGPSLVPPEAPNGRWTVLADLYLEPHPDDDRAAFLWGPPVGELPSGCLLVIADAARDDDPLRSILARGSVLIEVGQSTAERFDLGVDEAAFVGTPLEAPGGRLIVLRNVGSGPVRSQAAGLLVIPSTDILNAASGPIADDVKGASALLAATRPVRDPTRADVTAAAPQVAG